MTTRAIPFDQLQGILEHKFQFQFNKNAPDAKGSFVKLERCPLPIYNDKATYTGHDVLQMLTKLNEWRAIIDECETGLYDMLEYEIKLRQGKPAVLARPGQGESGERQPLSNENRKPEFHNTPRHPRPRGGQNGNR